MRHLVRRNYCPQNHVRISTSPLAVKLTTRHSAIMTHSRQRNKMNVMMVHIRDDFDKLVFPINVGFTFGKESFIQFLVGGGGGERWRVDDPQGSIFLT